MIDMPHILIVDDHRDIREPLRKYLEKNGCRVSEASDAASARAGYRRAGHHDAGRRWVEPDP